jgi:hypothetical protein
MSYRRPAVTVIQEFVGLAPALATFALPSVAVGPAYQLVDDDLLGTYSGAQHAYAYASIMGGAQVDLDLLSDSEVYPATKKPIEVFIRSAVVQIVPSVNTGAVTGQTFTDVTADIFENVKVGDVVRITGQGNFRVKTVIDDNTLTLETPATTGTGLTYVVVREVAEIELDRVDSLPGNGFLATEDAITLPGGLQVVIESNNYDIIEGNVESNYRALRNDLSANVREYSRLSDVQAFFGTTQISPANPLAFALSVMLQNTTTPVNGLGLDGNAVSDETLSYQNALDVLAMTEMYALVPLTQNPVIHQLFKSHVEGLSVPAKRKERVAIFNRTLISIETLVDDTTTSTSTTGARTIVSTQTDGEHDGTNLDQLEDATTDAFLNVEPGDTLVITGGTRVTLGNYTIQSKTDNNNIVTSTAFAQSGAAVTDVAYYIVRKDGLGADGETFYDRNVQFITSGVAAGAYLNVAAGTAIGRHRITEVVSEYEIKVEQVNGVTSLVTAVEYAVERDLTKTEQANAIKGYSSGFATRRCVNLWPDILETPVGTETYDLPGYYGAVVIGALTTGLPTQQGLTNLSVSGFLGLKHSSGYFNDDQLDIIADGGTMILAQAADEAPLYIRHQLTTDRSAIKFQEYSVTKNVDFIAKFIRSQYASFIGQWNIVDTTLDELKLNAKATINFLKDDTKLPKIGGVIRSGQLKSLTEDETQIDTVKMRFGFNIPIPLNNLDITIEV